MMRLLSLFVLCLFVLPATAANLVPNSSFEVDRGWIAWGGNTTDALGNITNLHNRFISTNDAAHGNRVFSLQGGRLISKPFYALAGSYRFTFSARGDPGNLARLDWGVAGERGSPVNPPNNVTLSSSWQRFTNTVTLTSVSNYMVQFEEWNGSQVIIDAVQFETGTVASAFSPMPIEFGFSTTNLDNNFMAGETPTVNLDFWNDGASTSATAVWRIYDAFNRVMQATTNEVSLAPNSATTLPVVLPVTNGYMRLHGYLSGIDNSWDELAISKLPYARSGTQDTNGILGVHTHYSRYHSAGLREAGFKWGRGLSPGLAIRWSLVEASAVSGFDWSAMDFYVTGQATNGQVLLVNLHGWPTWAVDGAGNPSNNLFINFVTNAVDRYRNYVWNWEILNEPQNAAENNGWTWWQNYTNLSRLMADAAAAIKSMQSTGIVVGMGGIGDGAYAYQVFTNMTVGERANLDAVSGHLYPQPHSLDPNDPENDYGYSISVYSWRQNFIAANVKPVWNTESGIWISSGYHGDGYFYGYSYFEPFESGYSPEVLRNDPVARVYVRTDMILHTAARSLGWGFKKFFYYDGRYPNSSHLHDVVNGADPTVYEFNSSFKPNGVGLLTLQHYLGVGIDRITNSTSANIEAYLFPSATFGNVIAAWNLDRTNRTLTFTNAEIAVVDAFGNGIQTNSLTARVTRNLRYYLSGSLTQNQLSNTFKYASVADATDTLAPAVSIDVSPIGPVDGSRRLLKWTAIEDTSVPWYQNNHDTNILYKYRTQPNTAYSPWFQSNYVWATFSPGVHNLDVVAVDAKGNESQAVLGPEFSVGESFYLRNFLIASQQVQVVVWPCESNKITATTALTNVSDGGNLQQYQQLSGSRMAALLEVKAKFTNQVTLVSGLAPTNQSRQFGFIGINTNTDPTGTWLYEFTNGHCGFRIVNPITANSNLFAIQGLILRNGEIICQTNLMYDNQNGHATSPSGDGTWRLGTNAINITNRTVELIDHGPLRVWVKVRDEYDRAAWTSGTNSQPAGLGYSETYVLFEATSRSIVVHHDLNGQVVYGFELPEIYRSAGAQWRFRQQYLDTSGETGYLWGQATNYPSRLNGVYWDFYRDINLTREIVPYFDRMSEFQQVGANWIYGIGGWHMGFHSQYGSEGGARPVYCSFGNTNNGASSNIIGFFEGPIDWTGTTGWEPVQWVTPIDGAFISQFFFTNAPRTIKTATGIMFHSDHVSQGFTNFHHRYAYGIYLGGTNGTWIDSTNAYFSDIEKEYCLYSYIPARKMLVEYGVLDGEVGEKAIYGRMFGNTITGIVARLRADSSIDALIQTLTGDDVLYYMWNDPTGVQTTNLATNILYNLEGNAFLAPLLAAGGGLSTFAHIQWGHGPYTAEMTGLQGLSVLQRFLIRIDQVLGDATLLNGFQEWELLSAANLVCRMQFDQNWKGYPTNLQSLLTGGGNFQLQEIGARSVAALYATNLAVLDYARTGVSNEAATVFLTTAQDDGTTGGSVSYVGTVTGPSLITFMQLKANGQDVMASAGIAPMITNHCEYLLALDSGIDTRDSLGAYIVFGDATTGHMGHAGSWATLIRDYAPGLYLRMVRKMWQDNHVLNSYNVEPVLWLDVDAPTNSQPIATSRFATGTGALFHFNTESTNNAHIMFQSDGWGVNQSFGHGYDDAGVAFVYAYGAPVSVQPHAYGISPYAGWPQTRPMAMRTNIWPTWNDPTADSTATLGSGYTALSAVHTNTLFFSYSGNADTMVTNGAGKFWYRQFSPITVSPNFQVYRYGDQFDPADTNLIQHALYATNDVGGDLGTLIPPERNMSAGEAPRAGTNVSFTPGLKVLTLAGTPFAAHPAGGLDFQLAILNTSPSNTLNAYAVSHDVTSHEEQIYVHYDVTNGNSLSWIVARPKGVGAPTITTNPATSSLILVTATEEMHVRSNSWEFATGTSSIGAATFDGNTLTATNGIGISGGPAEAVISRSSTTNIIVSASGSIGLRTITNSTLPYPLIIATDGQSSRTMGIRRQ